MFVVYPPSTLCYGASVLWVMTQAIPGRFTGEKSKVITLLIIHRDTQRDSIGRGLQIIFTFVWFAFTLYFIQADQTA